MGDWQLVSRRKGGAQQGDLATSAPLPACQPYIPYLTKPLYSQVTLSQPPQKPSPQPIPTKNQPSKPTMATQTPSPTSSPPPPQATYYISPHSPTQLRFPPSPQFTEWRGRCFRCCRNSHSSAVCRNPMRCGKCWGEGHTGFRCKTNMLNPAALPYWSNRAQQPPAKTELKKSFDDLLLKPCPLSAPAMPANRPKRLAYFADRDPAFIK